MDCKASEFSSFMRIIPWLSHLKKSAPNANFGNVFWKSFCLHKKIGNCSISWYLNRACKFYIFINLPANFMHLQIEITLWMCHKTSNVKLWTNLRCKTFSRKAVATPFSPSPLKDLSPLNGRLYTHLMLRVFLNNCIALLYFSFFDTENPILLNNE